MESGTIPAKSRHWPGLLLGILLILPAAVQADFSTIVVNGQIRITAYSGAGGDLVIPETIDGLPVAEIGDGAFGSAKLTSVVIPDSVTSIGDEAFAHCGSMASAVLGDSVATIGQAAFSGCGALTSLAIPASITSFGFNALFDCASLTKVTVDAANPNYLSEEGVLFTKDKSILIHCPARKAGSYAIPVGVKEIEALAFSFCIDLTSVVIPAGVTAIGDGAFYQCFSLTSVVIPDGVLALGDYSFRECVALPTVTIPDSVTMIGESAFFRCENLGSIDLGDGVTSIGESAFYRCSSLSVLETGVGLTSIGEAAFLQCAGLATLMIGPSVATIGDFAFLECDNLTAILVDAANPDFCSEGGVLFDRPKTTLVQCPPGKTGRYVVPDSVTFIGQGAFYGCAGLNRVVIGSQVDLIGYNSFTDCTGLTGVYFEGNPPSLVWDEVFSGASQATIYYLSTAAGWGPDYGGRPTVLWDPRVNTDDGLFGVVSNVFGFSLVGAPGLLVAVEACSNPADPEWQEMGTLTLTGGTAYFSDPDWESHPVRIYRLRTP